MITASELAGHFAAHTVWTLSEADSFHPVLAYTSEDWQRHMERVFAAEAQDAVAFGRKKMIANPMDANDAVLLFDGRISGPNGKRDAIIIEMRCHAFPWAEAAIGVPYTPRTPGPLRVHVPKILQWKDCADFDKHAAFEAFFRGVSSHPQGSKAWDDALDERQ